MADFIQKEKHTFPRGVNHLLYTGLMIKNFQIPEEKKSRNIGKNEESIKDTEAPKKWYSADLWGREEE